MCKIMLYIPKIIIMSIDLKSFLLIIKHAIAAHKPSFLQKKNL